MAAVYAITDHFEQKGYNRAVVELQTKANKEITKATNKAVKKAAKEMQKALDLQQAVFDAELIRAEQTQEVEIKTKKVIEYVDRIKIKNECVTTGDDVIRLLNDSINTSNVTSH